MSKLDEKVEFRIAKLEDMDSIMKFIKDYWREDHILATDKGFFLYEYANGDGSVNFNLAIDRTSNELLAIHGFYKYSLNERYENSDIAGSIFRTNPNCSIPMLGMEMAKRFVSNIKGTYIGVGINPVTVMPMSRNVMGHKLVGRLKHYYRLNDSLSQYQMAKIENYVNEKKVLGGKSLRLYSSIDELKRYFDFETYRSRAPYKDSNYIEKRYFHHPIYKYYIYGIGEEKVSAALVLRLVQHETSCAIRIVDILGECNQISEVGEALDNIMKDNHCEYMDLYEYGVPDIDIYKAGFIERKVDDHNIIPNYMEPFVMKNIEIYFDSSEKDVCIFKGDGDQDRPNVR